MRPRLVHPVAVRVEQVVGAGTFVDPDFREPQGAAVARASVDLVGQLQELRTSELGLTAGGDSPLSTAVGRVVFEIDALAAAGAVLHLADRITHLAGVAVDPPHRILRLEDKAHYAGRAWHRWAWYGPEDR